MELLWDLKSTLDIAKRYGCLWNDLPLCFAKRQPQRKSWWGVKVYINWCARVAKKNFFSDVGHLMALGNFCHALLRDKKRERLRGWEIQETRRDSRAPGIEVFFVLAGAPPCEDKRRRFRENPEISHFSNFPFFWIFRKNEKLKKLGNKKN